MEKNKMNSLVSIVIPMYNSQLYIERCLQSLLDQTYTQIEILVVDDGSTDQSANIVKRLQNKSNTIKYLYQQNSGPGLARNKAIEVAKGKYLLFVDADDYLSNDYIFDLVKCAENNQSELTIGGYTWVCEGKKKKKVVIPQRYIQHSAEEWAYRISACWSRLYLMEFWKKSGLKFNIDKEARAEDVPIVLFSNVMAKNISIVKNAGYYYYQHQGSAMNNREKRVLFGFPYDAFDEMYKKIKQNKMENSSVFFNIGILKFLAQFDLVIYRHASSVEKERFKKYLKKVIGKDMKRIIAEWKDNRRKVDFPIIHKIAIQVFVWKYKDIMEG